MRRGANPFYWKFLKVFEGLTSLPVLLNTSFNEDEPIVHWPGRRWTASCGQTWMCW